MENLGKIYSVEQLEEFLNNREGLRGERLSRSEAQRLRAYIDRRIRQVKILKINFLNSIYSICFIIDNINHKLIILIQGLLEPIGFGPVSHLGLEELGRLYSVEQLEIFYENREGLQGERLSRAQAQNLRQYIDWRVRQVKLIF